VSPLAFCAVCGRTLALSDAPHSPFCSERCRLSDLYGWLNDGHVISEPLAPEDGAGEDEPPDGDGRSDNAVGSPENSHS
jgi:endogenous inhibitor of DNA gyrase (YacG/DUF329 family)